MSSVSTTLSNTLAANKVLATSAAVLEAGYIANSQLSKLAAKKLPLMVRGYAEEPIGKLVLANLVMMAVKQFRPDDKNLARLSDAMVGSAYQEFIRSFDIDGLLSELMDNTKVKSAFRKLDTED